MHRRVKYIFPAHVGFDSDDDTRNCAVRALSNATGQPYARSFETFERLGRVKGNGADIVICHKAYLNAGGRLVDVYGLSLQAAHYAHFTGIDATQSMTLSKLLKTIPAKGRYIAVITRHALAIVDGVTIDTGGSKAGARVTALYKFD